MDRTSSKLNKTLVDCDEKTHKVLGGNTRAPSVNEKNTRYTPIKAVGER